jgi:hypothetical protein
MTVPTSPETIGAAPGDEVPFPVLVEMKDGRVLPPGRGDVEALAQV